METGGFRPVPVWDGIVRATHWVDALCVAALLVLGGLIWLEEPLGLAKAARATLRDAEQEEAEIGDPGERVVREIKGRLAPESAQVVAQGGEKLGAARRIQRHEIAPRGGPVGRTDEIRKPQAQRGREDEADRGMGDGHMMHHGMHGHWMHWLEKADANGDGKVTKDEFMQAAKRYAEKKFAWMDANGDGVIDDKDRAARMDRHFDAMDANHDGRITREEWRAFHEKMHGMHGKPMKGGM